MEPTTSKRLELGRGSRPWGDPETSHRGAPGQAIGFSERQGPGGAGQGGRGRGRWRGARDTLGNGSR
jgi:hypothetical protein